MEMKGWIAYFLVVCLLVGLMAFVGYVSQDKEAPLPIEEQEVPVEEPALPIEVPEVPVETPIEEPETPVEEPETPTGPPADFLTAASARHTTIKDGDGTIAVSIVPDYWSPRNYNDLALKYGYRLRCTASNESLKTAVFRWTAPAGATIDSASINAAGPVEDSVKQVNGNFVDFQLDYDCSTHQIINGDIGVRVFFDPDNTCRIESAYHGGEVITDGEVWCAPYSAPKTCVGNEFESLGGEQSYCDSV